MFCLVLFIDRRGAGLLHIAWIFTSACGTPRQIRLIHRFGREVLYFRCVKPLGISLSSFNDQPKERYNCDGRVVKALDLK